jgi:hypothetical protein
MQEIFQMSETLLIIIVLFVGIGGLVGVGYFLDRHIQNSKPVGPVLSELGPTGKVLLQIVRILVIMMVLSLIGFVAFVAYRFFQLILAIGSIHE